MNPNRNLVQLAQLAGIAYVGASAIALKRRWVLEQIKKNLTSGRTARISPEPPEPYGNELTIAISNKNRPEICRIINKYQNRKNILKKIPQLNLSFCTCCKNVVLGVTQGYDEDRNFCQDCLVQCVFSRCMDGYILQQDALVYYATSSDYEDGSKDYATRDWVNQEYEHPNNPWVFFSEQAFDDLGFSNHDDDEDDEDDYDYDEDEDEEGCIGAYHSSKQETKHIPDLTDPVTLGVELEIEVKTNYPIQEKAKYVLDSLNASGYYASAEADASLDRGFEIVTCWTSLGKQKQFLKPLDNLDKAGLASHNTSTCGLHVHVSKTGIDVFHAAKLTAFIHSPENRDLITCVARRYGDSYAKFFGHEEHLPVITKLASKSKSKSWKLKAFNGYEGRHQALNWDNENTIEFRMFKGTLVYATICACLEFAYHAVAFTREAGMSRLGPNDFCAYLLACKDRKSTKYLRQYYHLKELPVYMEELAKAKVKSKVSGNNLLPLTCEI